jgi:rSAM/selenodomain-associated transferase 2
MTPRGARTSCDTSDSSRPSSSDDTSALWYAGLAPLVSVIVPVRNDADALAQLLEQLRPSPDALEIEVIVACASPIGDDIDALRRRLGNVTWVEAPPGRGMQLNAGAARARGQWLWFVHADSQLAPGWLDEFRNLEAGSSEVSGGAFRFALDSRAWQARVLERAVALRVRWFSLPYGDQGLFVRRSVFEALGGFAPIPLMEDVDFVRRLKRFGRLRHLTVTVTTSARRWEREGWWRRSASNLLTLALYQAGVSPERLAKRYYG